MHRHKYSWVIEIRNTSEAVLRSQYTLGHYNDCSPMGRGQYNGLGEDCDPHIASSVFLILLFNGIYYQPEVKRGEYWGLGVLLAILPSCQDMKFIAL